MSVVRILIPVFIRLYDRHINILVGSTIFVILTANVGNHRAAAVRTGEFGMGL